MIDLKLNEGIAIRDWIAMMLMVLAGATIGIFDQVWQVLAVGAPLIILGFWFHSPAGESTGPNEPWDEENQQRASR